MDAELEKKDKMIEELLSPDQGVNSSGFGRGKTLNKIKIETHLTGALKRQIKDLKSEMIKKEEEMLKLKRNIKVTKLNEFDVEIKVYQDECTRLKHMLGEVINSRDPL